MTENAIKKPLAEAVNLCETDETHGPATSVFKDGMFYANVCAECATELNKARVARIQREAQAIMRRAQLRGMR